MDFWIAILAVFVVLLIWSDVRSRFPRVGKGTVVRIDFSQFDGFFEGNITINPFLCPNHHLPMKTKDGQEHCFRVESVYWMYGSSGWTNTVYVEPCDSDALPAYFADQEWSVARGPG